MEIIKILVDKGMSVNLTNAGDSTPLHLSALIGNLEATKALSERGAPLNNPDNDGETPLFLAARCGKIEVFRYLTEIGADNNIHDINSNTALHHACQHCLKEHLFRKELSLLRDYQFELINVAA